MPRHKERWWAIELGSDPYNDPAPAVVTDAPTAGTEADFQAQVIAAAEQRGWLTYHNPDSRRSNPGFPDLVLAHKRRGIIFAELKVGKNRPSKPQTKWLNTIEESGHCAQLWTPADWPRIIRMLEWSARDVDIAYT